MYQYNEGEYISRMQWYRQVRLGMFIHFGLYSIPARGEWVRSNEYMPEEDYIHFFRQFNPKGFDAARWAREAISFLTLGQMETVSFLLSL